MKETAMSRPQPRAVAGILVGAITLLVTIAYWVVIALHAGGHSGGGGGGGGY
jgi:hypothetical protein